MGPLKLEIAMRTLRGRVRAMMYLLWPSDSHLVLCCALRRFGDDVSHLLGLLQHGHVTGLQWNCLSSRLLRGGLFHRRSQRLVFHRDHMPGWLRFPRRVSQLLVEHRTVRLSLYHQNELTLGHRKPLGKVVENPFRRHPCEVLGIDLDRLLSWRQPIG